MTDFKRVVDWYIQTPLVDNANIIDVRMTQLETFYDCPYAFKFWNIRRAEKSKEKYNKWTPVYKLWKTFLQGTILHKATYNYIVAYNVFKDAWKWEDEIEHDLIWVRQQIEANIMKHRQLYDIESVIKSFRMFIRERGPFKRMKYDSFLSELWMNIMFQFWDIWINLSWTPDHVFYDEKWIMHMMDVKTSKHKRHPVDTEKWEAEYKNRIQWRWYPVLTSFFAKDVECRWPYKFQYFPITKQVKPQVTHDFIIPDTTFEKSERFLLALVTKFVNAYRTDTYKTDPTTKRCFYCPLKKYGLCPHFAQEWF